MHAISPRELERIHGTPPRATPVTEYATSDGSRRPVPINPTYLGLLGGPVVGVDQAGLVTEYNGDNRLDADINAGEIDDEGAFLERETCSEAINDLMDRSSKPSRE
ncbi:MAG: hypothetical protein IIA87_02000 [Nanoarchaeota archaeon]|nr:hypothetical protein [Nanoarchaeota archaeon]